MRSGLAAVLWLALASFAAAADYPALTGRVVDAAHILSPIAAADLERKLADLEQKSGIQLVVATVPSLNGEDIAPYANDLFRAWKLGEAKKNNGILLLVAPNERRVRIEVGYGLEGTLTDAASALIISNAIATRFKQGNFDAGVTSGVDDTIAVLTTDPSEWQKKPELRSEDQASLFDTLAPIIFMLIVIFIVLRFRRGRYAGPFVVFTPGATFSRGGFGGGGFSGGGFFGGGGSSGGGGASGSW